MKRAEVAISPVVQKGTNIIVASHAYLVSVCSFEQWTMSNMLAGKSTIWYILLTVVSVIFLSPGHLVCCVN